MRRSLLLLLALAACAPAVATFPELEPEPPAPVFVQLDDDEIRALAALLRMEDRRELEPRLHAVLSTHANPVVRSRAALAAGRVAGDAAAAAVLPFLADSVTAVRADAAFALGLLADTTAIVVDALTRIAGQPAVNEDAIEAIHALARAGGRDALLGLLTPPAATTDDSLDEAASDAVPADSVARRAAHERRTAEIAFALWRLPRSESVSQHLIRLAAVENPDIRKAAAYSLSRTSPPAAARTLHALLDDDDALIRSYAARALRGAVVDSAGLRAEVRPALITLLDDGDAHVRISAARALGSYAEAAVVAPLARLLVEADSNVVLAATEALATVGPPAAAELQRVAADDGARTVIRAAALNGLVRHDAAAAEPVLATWQRSSDWLRRMAAARALGAASWQAAGPRLLELARDADARVAAAALGSIAGAAPANAAIAVQTEALASPHVAVRAAAIRGIARHAGPGHLAILLEAYAAAQEDADTDAAIAAVDALAALAEQGIPVQRAFYARFPAPPDPVLRRHAAQRLGPSPWQWRPVETARSDAWYERIVRSHIAAHLAGEPLPRAVIEGPSGSIVVELDAPTAPLTVENFITLAEQGFFEHDTATGSPRWHRVVPNFVLQDGDPFGDGSGGPGYSIRDELNRIRYDRGVLGMALAGPDTGGSQWFITHSPQPHLDAGYTAFGRVISGMDVADRVLQDDPIYRIRIERGGLLGGS